MRRRTDTLHNRLIDFACQHGWQRRGWKTAVRKELSKSMWSEESSDIIDLVNATPCIPDAWRLRVEQEGEGPGWSYPVLVLELLEVEVTHPIDSVKLDYYEKLWWNFDGTSHLHLRIFRMDRYGFVLPFLTEGLSIFFLARHRPDGREPMWYVEVPFLPVDLAETDEENRNEL